MAQNVHASTDLGTSGQSEVSDTSTIVHAQKRKSAGSSGHVDYSEQDRQWDIRRNLGPGDCSLQDAERELEFFLEKVRTWENIKYVLVGGIEVGDNPSQDDYQRFHVHCCLILRSPTTRRSVVHNLALSRYSNGSECSYYLARRNPFSSFSGWRNHHIKERTKVGKDLVSYEAGEAPKEYASSLLPKGTVGKLKQDDMLREIMQLFSQGKKDQAFQDYPALTLRYHAQITALVKNRNEPPTVIDHSPRMWIYGPPGTGKSAYVAYKYPRAYKKSLARNELQYFNGEAVWFCNIYL